MLTIQAQSADNHLNQGVAFNNVKGMLFAIIAFGEREGGVTVNFGEKKFAYDLDTHDWTKEETAASVRARTLDSVPFGSSISLAELRRSSRVGQPGDF